MPSGGLHPKEKDVCPLRKRAFEFIMGSKGNG
jgi:hypothetical protein